MQYCQGDVMITPIKDAYEHDLTAVPRENGAVVLAHGEVTGHTHRIDAPSAKLFVQKTRTAEAALLNVRFLQIMEACVVEHEEHAPITLEAGWYMVQQQREWTDAEEPLRVAD